MRPPAAGDDKRERESAEREGAAGLPNGRRACQGASRAPELVPGEPRLAGVTRRYMVVRVVRGPPVHTRAIDITTFLAGYIHPSTP